MIDKIKSGYKKLHDYLINFSEWKYFNEFYCAIFMFIALFGWRFNDMVGISIMIGLSAFILILFNDINYIIPPIIYMMFMMSKGLSNDEIPYHIIIPAAIFILVLIVYLVFNIKKQGIILKKMSSLWGLLGLAIMNIIPIFWANIESPNEVFYFFYFTDLAYLVIYFLVVNGIKKFDLKLLSVAMSYLALLLTAECIYKVAELKIANPDADIFTFWYYLGWGLCNEAGIMICFSVPFTVYVMTKSTNIWGLILQSLKILIGIVGVLLTTSRGSYLCVFGLTGVLIISLAFINKVKKQYLIYVAFLVLIFIGGILVLHEYTFPLINNVIHEVFDMGLDNNGRTDLWRRGWNAFTEDALTMILGPGFCSVYEYNSTAAGMQLVPYVMHSTLLQTLLMGGIFGLVMLIIHFITKYRNSAKLGKTFFLSIGIGFIVIDFYGLIDNTYHMFYYMIPLVITLAVMDGYVYNNQKA